MDIIKERCSTTLVHHFLENSAKRMPEKIALISDGKRFSYRELNRRSNCIARTLVGIGLGKDSKILIYLDNSVEAIVAIFGILKAGAIFVVANPLLKEKKLKYILDDSGAHAIITDKNKINTVKNAISKNNSIKHIIISSPENNNIKEKIYDGVAPVKIYSFEAAINKKYNYIARDATIDVNLATIIYTSGSTGKPKGIMSAHYNMVSACRSITTYIENIEKDIILGCLPLSFDYGLYQVLMTFMIGGTIVLKKSFNYMHDVLTTIQNEKITGFPIVPTIVALLCKIKEISKYDFSSVRYITNTGAALPYYYIKKLIKIFPNAKIFSMYGLTECKRVSYLPPEKINYKPESVGIPMSNCRVVIVDEDGKRVGVNEVGELVVSGANVMQGYWNDPKETKKRFRPGKYRDDVLLYTGDLFRKDEEGYLYFVGRKDDMLKVKGERVSPKEIEFAIIEIEGVIQCAVIGIPNDILGHAIKAFIMIEKGCALEVQDIRHYLQKNLEPHLVPQEIEICDNLPKTPSGKIDKTALS